MSKYIPSKIFILSISFFLIFCIQQVSFSLDYRINVNNKTDTNWKYLGRPRPGMTPLRFPPDSLLATNNWMWHGTPIFSPDLKEMFWTKYDRIIEIGQLVYIKYINNNWTSMQFAPFGNTSVWENNPHYSYSGDTLYFYSLRPGGNIFRVCRNTSGWTTPEALNIPIPSGYNMGMSFSIARSGTIYFELYPTGFGLRTDMYRTKLVNGQYQMPESLGNTVNSDSSDICGYIDPYERFLIFISKRAGGYGYHDIYLTTRRADSTWRSPVNLGAPVNSNFEDVFPFITPDGLYFFYTTAKYGDIGYNPYWISAQYIYNLVSVGIEESSATVKEFELFQNYPNPFNPSTNIKFSIPPGRKTGEKFTTLNVYNILGKVISTLVNQKLSAGSYEVTFDGSDFPSGAYYYKISCGNYSETRKMLLIK